MKIIRNAGPIPTCQCNGCTKPVSTGPGTTGKYCSLSCGSKQAAANRKRSKIVAYNLAPKLCVHCQKPLSYEKRNSNQFCSSSCAAAHNNVERIKNGYVVTKEHKDKTSASSKGRPSTRVKKELRNNAPVEIHLGKYSKVSFCIICSTAVPHKHQRTCSPECKSIALSNNAKKRGLGGNKNTRAYGWYESPTAGRVWLESSYEYRVAKDLDEAEIEWTRPEYMPYVLNNQSKKYYADFYLVDQDVYLDPKNDFLITQDKSKIEAVSEQNHVKILILNKHQLSWSCIKQLIENYQC